MTIESANAKFFVDGVLVQTISDIELNTVSPMYFGAGGTDAASQRQFYFNGSIDDLLSPGSPPPRCPLYELEGAGNRTGAGETEDPYVPVYLTSFDLP